MLFEEFFKPIFEDLLPSARKINSKQALQSSFDFEEYTATTVLQEGLRTFGLYRQEYCARPQDYFITKLTAEQVYSLLFAACAMAMVWGHKSTAQIEHDLFKDLITWGKAINDYEERQAFAQVTKKLWSLSIDTQVDLAPQRASLHFQFTEYTKDCLNSEDMVEMSISLTTLMTGEISQMFVRFFDSMFQSIFITSVVVH